MKTIQLIKTLTAVAVLTAVVGCNKDSAAQPEMNKAATDAGDAVKNAADAMKEGGEKVAQDVKQAGEAVAKDVTQKAEELAAPINAKAQEVIDGTKKLFSEGKFEAALAHLKSLGSEKLSAEQQTVVDNLKARINKAMGITSKTNAIRSPGTLLE